MGIETPAAPGRTPIPYRERYLRALIDADLVAARALLDEALADGMSAAEIYLDVLQPSLYEIGRLWSRAQISVAQEHLATAATQSAMARLAERLGERERRIRPGVALVACVSDELHAVGGRMVADFLEADGWRVVFLGALTPGGDLAALAAEHGAQVVALSAALADRVPSVAEMCASLRTIDPPPFVIVGGQAFGGSGAAALLTGADAFAADAQDAVRVLRERFPAAA